MCTSQATITGGTAYDPDLLPKAGILQQMDLKDPHAFLAIRPWGIHWCGALWACVVFRVITKLQVMRKFSEQMCTVVGIGIFIA